MTHPRQFLLDYLPTFCWQDYNEILKMADKFCEQENAFYDTNSLSVALCSLVKEGLVETKIPSVKRYGDGNNKRGFTYVYRRI